MQSAAKKFLDDEIQYDELYGQPEAAPRLTVTRTRGKVSGISRVRLLFCAAMLVSIVSLTIYNSVATVELGDRLNNQTNMLEKLREEGELLQSRLDNAISLSEVADRASSTMLMGSAEDYQITYISLGNGDVINRTTKTPDQLPAQRIVNTINKLQEYMSNR